MAHRYAYLAFAIVAILTVSSLKATKTVSEYVWIDEPYAVQRSSLAIAQLIQETAKEDVHPPGYYLALAAWFKVFHPSLLSARAFSVAFYFFACSVFLLWCLKVY